MDNGLRVFWDLDDTSIIYLPYWVQQFNKISRLNLQLNPSDIRVYNFGFIPGATEEIQRRVFASLSERVNGDRSILEKMPPYPGAVDVLKYIKSHSAESNIVTSRNEDIYGQDIKEISKNGIGFHGITQGEVYDKLFFAPNYNKIQIIRELKPQVGIDDRLDTVYDFLHDPEIMKYLELLIIFTTPTNSFDEKKDARLITIGHKEEYDRKKRMIEYVDNHPIVRRADMYPDPVLHANISELNTHWNIDFENLSEIRSVKKIFDEYLKTRQ